MTTFDDRNDSNANKLRMLYDKAYKFAMNGKSAECLWLYRNQSHEYFMDIDKNHDGVMEVRMKDNGGDPDCPINGRLWGLFFNASVQSGSESGEPIPISPFGRRRVLVPAEKLLDSANMYFADFYCMTSSNYHYVTLVITVPGSEADDFCDEHLPSADITAVDNPFLFVDGGTLFVTTTDRLLVEIFYTEDLDISKYERTDIPIPKFWKGHSTPGGILKNKSCGMCNL